MNLLDIMQMIAAAYDQSQAAVPKTYVYKQPAKATYTAQPHATQSYQPKVFGFNCPNIKRVTFNGNTTIVFFIDNTYAIVKCSTGDKYDRKTAIVYAMVKRMLGKLGKTDKNGKFHANEVDGNGFGCWLQDIVNKGFDQQLEEQTALEKKRTARAQHEARQAAEKKAAFDKRVEALAKDILLERAAIDRANEIEDAARAKQAECLKETTCSNKPASEDPKPYVKPDKPFREFTEQEKKDYWKYHNSKRKASKK